MNENASRAMQGSVGHVGKWTACALLAAMAATTFAADGAFVATSPAAQAARTTTCPMTTALLTVSTYTGRTTATICPSIFQYTTPIFFVAGMPSAQPQREGDPAWAAFTASMADVPPSPETPSTPPLCPAASLFTDAPGMQAYEICITGFTYAKPHFTFTGHVRGDGIFANGFEVI